MYTSAQICSLVNMRDVCYRFGDVLFQTWIQNAYSWWSLSEIWKKDFISNVLNYVLKTTELGEVRTGPGNLGHLVIITLRKTCKKRRGDWLLFALWLTRTKYLHVIFLFCRQMAMTFTSTTSNKHVTKQKHI